MITIRYAAAISSALATLSLVAYAQQPQRQSPGQSTISTPSTSTPGTRPSPSPDLNTDTNSQPDITATGGHATTDVRIRPGIGTLASAMANFSVRTGLEIGANANAQVVVSTVRPERPAARAGIEAGDVITRVDGMEVSTIGAFQKVITRRPSKPAFFLGLKRGDQSFRVPLGRQLTLMGMTLFPDSADRPIVAAVDPKSPAGYAGFQVGDMIAGFDHQLTATMNGILDFGIPFIRDMQQGQGIGFDVIRGGKKMKLSVTRPADADLPLLTSEQERHLHRLANGDDIRPQQQRSRGIKTGQLPGPMFP